MLEIFDLINMKYLYIIVTLGIICVICIFKEFKLGVIASITSAILISIIWGGLRALEYLKNYMKGEAIDYNMILENIKAVLIGIGIFFIITFIYYSIMFLKNSGKKRESKKRRKRRYF
ncbi:MAG: hypothetical protein Q4B63_01240 [Clostridium perfringens]|nr:hypothetical protein [Clostridium perfringens]